jgi:hypothetical protein
MSAVRGTDRAAMGDAGTIRMKGGRDTKGQGWTHFANVLDRVQLGRYPAVYAQKLFVHDRREG